MCEWYRLRAPLLSSSSSSQKQTFYAFVVLTFAGSLTERLFVSVASNISSINHEYDGHIICLWIPSEYFFFHRMAIKNVGGWCAYISIWLLDEFNFPKNDEVPTITQLSITFSPRRWILFCDFLWIYMIFHQVANHRGFSIEENEVKPLWHESCDHKIKISSHVFATLNCCRSALIPWSNKMCLIKLSRTKNPFRARSLFLQS